MHLFSFLSPKPTISESEIKTGLKWMIWDGATSNGFNSITTSGILAAFALALGATDVEIGILAASKERIRLDETITGVGRGLVRGSFESDHEIDTLFRAVFPVLPRIAEDIHVSGEYISDMLITGILEASNDHPKAFRDQVSAALRDFR